MRDFIFITILILFSCITLFAQTDQNLVCQTIEVVGPAGISLPGETIVFKAKVPEGTKGSVIFNWKVENGEIISGQQTDLINVRTFARLQRFDVIGTVDVAGLDGTCANSVSRAATVDSFHCGLATDEYGKISVREEMARLDNVAFQLSSYSGIGLFLIRLSHAETNSGAIRRVKRIRNLLKRRGITRNRVVFVYAESDISSTVIYLLPMNDIESFQKEFGVSSSIEKIKSTTIP
ncbi:MAG: hypothetical protein ABI999_05575 [Acidobacteriota bacterium]